MQAQKCQKNLDAFYSLSTESPEVLREVYEREVDQSIDRLFLVFSRRLLVFEVDEDDDTVSVYVKRATALDRHGLRQKSSVGIWPRFIGKPFGWGWVTVNQQGYCDGVLLSFNGINPNVSLEVIASSIKINGVVPEAEFQTVTVVKVEENGVLSVTSLLTPNPLTFAVFDEPGEGAAKRPSSDFVGTRTLNFSK